MAQRIKFSKDFRLSIYKLYNYTCQDPKCKSPDLSMPGSIRVLDHKIPLSKGGSNHISNIWLKCEPCDKRKKNSLKPNDVADYIAARIDFLSKCKTAKALRNKHQ